MATREKAAGVVICDAGPLIHLDELECLELLADFSEVLVPDAVWREVMRHRPSALGGVVPSLLRMSPLREFLSAELRSLTETMSLHRGEQEALALAVKRAGALLITDDTAARLAAASLGIKVHGTIGIVVRSIRRGQRTKPQVLELLRAIPEKSTLHLKRSLLQEVIGRVENDAR
jgi:predicted nucleic acid-binding protein